MRSPLSILSRGRLAGGIKKPLAMLAIGWLVTTSTPPTPTNESGDGFKKSEAQKERRDWQERIKLDDDLVFHVIKIWVEKCQT